jgi:uncharacterized protein (UPF0335 family)
MLEKKNEAYLKDIERMTVEKEALEQEMKKLGGLEVCFKCQPLTIA